MKVWTSWLSQNRQASFARFAPSRATLLLTLLFAGFLCADPVIAQQPLPGSQPATPAAPPGQSPAAPAASPAPQYPDSAAGLKQMLADLVALKHAGKEAELDARLAALVLPEYRVWFVRHFGESRGAEFAEAYSRIAGNLPQMLREAIPELAAPGKKWEITSVKPIMWRASPTDGDAKLLFVRVLQPVSVYDVTVPKSGRAIRYFVREGTDFRFVGTLTSSKPLRAPSRPSSQTDAGKRDGGGHKVQHAKLVHDVRPVYPDPRVNGLVRLQGLIGTDGRILELQVVAGRPELIMAAVTAVAQWRYQPMLLDGVPTEVHTIVDVVFEYRP